MYGSFLVETPCLISYAVIAAVSVGDKLDFLLVRQNDRSEETDGGAVERGIEGDGDRIAVLDPIRAGGADPGAGQDVGRPGRQLPHLFRALLVLDGDMQRAVRVRKRELLHHAGGPLCLVQVVHAGQGMMRQQRTGSHQPQYDDTCQKSLSHFASRKIRFLERSLTPWTLGRHPSLMDAKGCRPDANTGAKQLRTGLPA